MNIAVVKPRRVCGTVQSGEQFSVRAREGNQGGDANQDKIAKTCKAIQHSGLHENIQQETCDPGGCPTESEASISGATQARRTARIIRTTSQTVFSL